MKKIVLMSLLLLCGWISAGAVDLNKENRDPKYVESIVNRSQKIVDKLGLTDVKAAEDVCNIIANRYFELNDIYEIRDAKVKTVKESGLTGDAKNEALKAAENEKDAALYGWWKRVSLPWMRKIQIRNMRLSASTKDVSTIIWLSGDII